MSTPTRRQTAFQLLVLAVSFPTALHALGVLGWLTGGPVLLLAPLGAFALCLAASASLQRSQLAAVALAGVLFALLLCAALLLAVQGVDAFYDSQLYHLPSTIALREGWSPLLEESACAWKPKFCIPHPGIDHYPKAAWVVGASFYAVTGSFEAGKAGQLVSLLAAWLAAARLLVRFRFLPRGLAGLLASALVWNPIVIKQAGSAYVDGWLASALLLFCVLLLDFVCHRRRESLVLAAVALPFLLNLKFTALPYAGIVGLTALALAWRLHRQAIRPILAWLLPAGALGVAVLGFHPYLTNVIETGNPFHPAFRSQGPSILQKMAAPEFVARDRFSKLVLGTTSRSRPGDDWREREWLVPGSGWRVTPAVDDRYSGFGEPFALAALLSLGVLVTTREKAVWVLATGLLASVFVTEAGWWARLAPQAWWLPVLAALATRLPGRGPVARLAGAAILVILAYTIVATAVASASHALESRAYFEAALARLEREPAVIVPDREAGVGRRGFALTLRQRFRDAGYRLRVTPDPPKPCTREQRFRGASLCFQGAG